MELSIGIKKFEIWAEVNHINDDDLPFDCANLKENNGDLSEKGKNEIGKEHWCEKIRIHNDDGESFWASCNPCSDECNGGSSKERIQDVSNYWKSTNDADRCELPWVNRLSFDNWVKIRYGKVDSLTKERIWKECLKGENNEESLDSPDEETKSYTVSMNEDKELQILDLIEDKLNDDWYKGTESDDDDIDGMVEYLDLQGYDEFTDMDNEAYEQRRCKLLGILYKKPPPIHAETFKVTRYSIGPDEKFTKIVSQDKKEFVRTSANVAWIRQNLMKEMDELGQVRRPPT